MFQRNSFKITLPIIFLLLNGCMTTKPYSPSKYAQTAEISYEIDDGTFSVPSPQVKYGSTDRVDIFFRKSLIPKDKTVYMKVAGHGTVDRHTVNKVDANKKVRFTYHHKSVKGLSPFSNICITKAYVKLEPNQRYVLKGKTVAYKENKQDSRYRRRCHIQIINLNTNKVVADSGSFSNDGIIPN